MPIKPFGFTSSGTTSSSVVETAVPDSSLRRLSLDVSATGVVLFGPAMPRKIRCLTGTAVTIRLRDVVVQSRTATDTTSPSPFPLFTMTAGDEKLLDGEFFFGVHATVSGTSPSFRLEF